MLINPNTQVFDGDYQIIFSDIFIVFEGKLTVTEIGGYTIEFIFDKGTFNKATGGVFAQPDETNKRITITMKDFRTTLGAGSTNKLPIINLSDGRKVYFSVYVKSFSEESDVLEVTINFYLK